MMQVKDYDRVVVGLSGGKDSVACVLHLLDLGVDLRRIELHHHLVDGREGSALFDWPCSEDYARKFAKSLELPILFSWLMGGLEREMLRENERTAPTLWERPDGTIAQAGGNAGKFSTRRKFPQVSADLNVRWCSAYGKIHVLDKILCNDDRFVGARTLVVTGERAAESANRARYSCFEPHRSDLRNGKKKKRHVDHSRLILDWEEAKVWDILRAWGIHPHVAYRLGFGRLSCFQCIFADDDQMASSHLISPWHTQQHAAYEAEFGLTIHRQRSVMERISRGTPYAMLPEDIEQAMCEIYYQPIRVPTQDWRLPLGAFKKSGGPS